MCSFWGPGEGEAESWSVYPTTQGHFKSLCVTCLLMSHWLNQVIWLNPKLRSQKIHPPFCGRNYKVLWKGYTYREGWRAAAKKVIQCSYCHHHQQYYHHQPYHYHGPGLSSHWPLCSLIKHSWSFNWMKFSITKFFKKPYILVHFNFKK